MKKHDITAVCNALVDVLYEVPFTTLTDLQLTRGIMHLVDSRRQAEVLAHLRGLDHTIELGGSAMNAIRTLAALGLKTCFAGVVGKDDFGGRIQARMKQLHIDSRLSVIDHEATGSCIILITPDGERTMNTHLGASRLYDHNHIPDADVANSKALHVGGYQWDTDGQKGGILKALESARKGNAIISFDLADPFVVERHRDDFHRIITEHADIVFTNKEEARLMYQATPEEAARKIAEAGAIAVVKVGAEGAIVRDGEMTFKIEPYPTRVMDTTAAGDMFAAGFLFGHLKGKDHALCGKMGAYLASDVISRIGATISEAALAEVARM